jgi:hypothetical protein
MSKVLLGVVLLAAGAFLVGCATVSEVMEAEGGTYLISARASVLRGSTAGANSLAYEEAQKFCAHKGQRAVVVTASERDVYHSSAAVGWNASGGTGSAYTGASGAVNLRFRCLGPEQ